MRSKAVAALFIAATLAIGLSACSDDDGAAATNSASPSASASSTPSPSSTAPSSPSPSSTTASPVPTASATAAPVKAYKDDTLDKAEQCIVKIGNGFESQAYATIELPPVKSVCDTATGLIQRDNGPQAARAAVIIADEYAALAANNPAQGKVTGQIAHQAEYAAHADELRTILTATSPSSE